PEAWALQQWAHAHRRGRHLSALQPLRLRPVDRPDRPHPEPPQRGVRRCARLPGARHQRARRPPSGVLIDGVEVTVDREAVVVTASTPLAVVSSAVVGGGFTSARAVVNLHVPKSLRLEETEAHLAAFADRRRVPVPWVGLLTSAWTEKARVAEAEADGIRALAVVTVGLSNRLPAAPPRPAPRPPPPIHTLPAVHAPPHPPPPPP